MELKVSGIVLTHNSERTIARCLESLIWCDEICILDDYSTDGTLRIAEKFPTRIFQRKLQENFSQQRNYAISVAKNELIFFVDADEVVSKDLAKEIQQAILSTEYAGFLIPRITVFNGRKMRYGEFLQFSLLRLARKDSGKWEGRVHERWIIDGKIRKLHHPLLHTVGGVGEFLAKLNTYSSLRAAELFKDGKQSSYFTILLYPPVKFAINYIFKLGFLDGISGVVNAIGMSFYTFLVRGKLWLLWNETKKKV